MNAVQLTTTASLPHCQVPERTRQLHASACCPDLKPSPASPPSNMGQNCCIPRAAAPSMSAAARAPDPDPETVAMQALTSVACQLVNCQTPPWYRSLSVCRSVGHTHTDTCPESRSDACTQSRSVSLPRCTPARPHCSTHPQGQLIGTGWQGWG